MSIPMETMAKESTLTSAWPMRLRGGVIVVVAALAMTATLPGRTHGLGLIKAPLCLDMDMSELTFTSLNFWAIVLGSILCWPTGRLIDRFGAGAILTFVALGLGLAALAMSRAYEVWMLFATLTAVRGLGQGTLSVVSMTMIGKWFRGGLGPAMGVYTVLMAFGFIAGNFALLDAITHWDWRVAWAGIGALLCVVLAPLGLLTPRTPSVDFDSNPEIPKVDASSPGASLAQALGTPFFWIVTLAASLFNAMISAVTLLSQDLLAERGLGVEAIPKVLGMMTLCGLPANLLAGWLSRHLAIGRLLAVSMAALAGALFVFTRIDSLAVALLYGGLLGFSGGVITVLFFTAYGKAFGRPHLGSIQGVVQALSVLASALGPWLMALCRHHWRTSTPLFELVAGLALVLGTISWFVPMPSRWASPTR